MQLNKETKLFKMVLILLYRSVLIIFIRMSEKYFRFYTPMFQTLFYIHN